MKLGKLFLAANNSTTHTTIETQFAGSLTRLLLSPNASTALSAKGVHSLNYQVLHASPNSSFAHPGTSIVLHAYDSNGTYVEVSGLTHGLLLQFNESQALPTNAS